MDQITRSPEPSTARTDASSAPRGEELQQASNRFAELMAKESKDTRRSERDRPKDGDDHGESGQSGGEVRHDAAGSLPYGVYLPGERGDGSRQNESRPSPTEEFETADGELATQSEEFAPMFFGQPTRFDNRETRPTGGEKDNSKSGLRFDGDRPGYLGPPIQTTEDNRPRDGRFQSLVERDQYATPTETVHEQTLPTPGDLMLQAFSRPAIETPTPPTKLGAPTTISNADAIRELGAQIAERILISQSEAAGGKEMLIHLKDSVLPGTEVRMVHDGERLQVTFVTDHASSFHLLAAQQADLQARLGDHVVVNLTFDPEGMISRQRLDAPIATESEQQAGDDRRRDSDDRGQGRRRNQDQPQDRDA